MMTALGRLTNRITLVETHLKILQDRGIVIDKGIDSSASMCVEFIVPFFIAAACKDIGTQTDTPAGPAVRDVSVGTSSPSSHTTLSSSKITPPTTIETLSRTKMTPPTPIDETPTPHHSVSTKYHRHTDSTPRFTPHKIDFDSPVREHHQALFTDSRTPVSTPFIFYSVYEPIHL